LFGSTTRDPEAVEDRPRRVGAIECVEMDSGHVVVEKIVTLLEREVNADARDHLRIGFTPLQGAEELRRKTARAFGRLPPKLQAAATLALIEEQPYKEIAEALGISTGAVKLRVFRALRFLRKELKQQGIEP